MWYGAVSYEQFEYEADFSDGYSEFMAASP